eukprot:gene13898-16397_t
MVESNKENEKKIQNFFKELHEYLMIEEHKVTKAFIQNTETINKHIADTQTCIDTIKNHSRASGDTEAREAVDESEHTQQQLVETEPSFDIKELYDQYQYLTSTLSSDITIPIYTFTVDTDLSNKLREDVRSVYTLDFEDMVLEVIPGLCEHDILKVIGTPERLSYFISKQWYDRWNSNTVPKDELGPIDNSQLIIPLLNPALEFSSDEHQFQVVHWRLWETLKRTYGCSHSIARDSANKISFDPPIESLNLYFFGSRDKTVHLKYTVLKNETVGSVKKRACEALYIYSSSLFKMWDYHDQKKRSLKPLDENKLISESNLEDNQQV